MKAIELNIICDALKIDRIINKHIIIKNVIINTNEIANNTLLFHLDKTQEININKFRTLHNCYIITDQPTLIGQEILQEYFINVVDVELAYKQFIYFYRSLFHIPVVAITGTCGKTTTKEMIKQVLETKYKISSTILSKNSIRFNHEYLMNIDDTTDAGVFETGLTDPGDLIYSCSFFKPNIGVITNIGIDHLSGCKTFDNYIRAKGEILAGLLYKGLLLINSDDENIKKINLTNFKGKVITFGIKEKADFYGTNISHGKKGLNFRLIFKDKEYEVYIPGIGEHNVYNTLAALTVLHTLGFNLEEAITHLASFKHVQSHLEHHKGLNNSTIIDDTWSSNPTSVKAAFEALKNNKRPKIAILGNISYLGDFALEQCKEIGKMIVDYKIDYLITKDAFSKQIGKEAELLGMKKDHIFNCKNESEIIKVMEGLLKPKTIALFKISMFDKSMIKVMEYFIKD